MTQTNNEREAFLDKLLAEYWDIAYSEGNSGLWHGKKAQSTLNDIRKLFKTQSPISQNEQQPKQIPDGWKLVPIEPTQSMLDDVYVDIGCGGYNNCGLYVNDNHAKLVYAQMLNAAPTTSLTNMEVVE